MMTPFPQTVMQAQRELQEALQAGARPSSFTQQGVMPAAPAAPQMPPQMPMMPPQMPMMPPQMPMMPPQMPQQPAMPVQQFAKGGLAVKKMAAGGAWTRKEGQNPEGGLNAKGRASLKAQGHDIKPPVSAKQAKKSPKAAARRKSFCARMSGMEGPMKDDKGRPTRKALALRKWDC